MTDEKKQRDPWEGWLERAVVWLNSVGSAHPYPTPPQAPENQADDPSLTEDPEDPEEREESAEAAFWNTDDDADLRNYPPGSYRTKSGRVLRPEDIERLVEEAEAGYDLSVEPAPAVSTVVKLLDPSAPPEWHGWKVVEVKMMPGSFTHLRVGVRHTSGHTVFYHFTYQPHGVRR